MFRRFCDWLSRRMAAEPVWLPPEPPVGALELRRQLSPPIVVPAAGDVFEFEAQVTIVWRSEGITHGVLSYWADQHSDRARHTVYQKVSDVARNFEPHRARDLEVALNAELRRLTWRCEEAGQALRYQAVVRVRPDERVRERLLPYWEKRIELECAHELGLRRAELVADRTQIWSAVLEKLEHDPVTKHAARLSEDQFAAVLERLIADRSQVTKNIVDYLKEAVRGHDAVGLAPSDYTKAWDAALDAFRRQNGLDLGKSSEAGSAG